MLLHIFWGKSEIFQKVHFKGDHCSFILGDKIVIISVNSISNVAVTGANPLRKHQMKNICFALFIFNQSKIQFEILEQY